jgi:triosephosphate isomerase
VNKLCFGNWKLNKDLGEAKTFIQDLESLVQADQLKSFAIFPPALVASAFAEQSKLLWGGQNIFKKDSGAFTGENSASVLKSMGASYVLIGHSERRSLFHETDNDVLDKTITALENQLTPVVCIGESLKERESGLVFEVLSKQLNEGLKGVDLKSVIIAYEPVWAIGTGKTATPKEVEEVHSWLRDKVGNQDTPLLYGGSVKPDNARNLFMIDDVNGFLIGGASLEPKSLYQIYENMTV